MKRRIHDGYDYFYFYFYFKLLLPLLLTESPLFTTTLNMYFLCGIKSCGK